MVSGCVLLAAACLSLAAAARSPVMSLEALPDPRPYDYLTPFARDDAARNINLQRNIESKIPSKFPNAEDELNFLKRKRADHRAKHPFLITKDDIENKDAIVEDNVIVESNVLRLVRPGRKGSNEVLRSQLYDEAGSLTPHRRVARGWNLQHVIVPRQLYYYRYRNARY